MNNNLKKIPLIIDTDPGIDDAIAIGLALFNDNIDVKLITTVFGNSGVNNTTKNAIDLVTFWKSKTPIAKGCVEPLIKKMKYEDETIDLIHGASGMGKHTFTDEGDKSLLLPKHAIFHMKEVIKNSPEPITIMAIAPLTNIALLFKIFPEVKDKIKEIVILGGALGRGNAGVMSEWNIYSDPEAAKIVFSSGVKVVLVPLDTAWTCNLFLKDIEEIKVMHETGNLFHSLIHSVDKTFWVEKDDTVTLYDVLALGYIVNPSMYTFKEAFIDIEIKSEYTYGTTIIDLDNKLKQKNNVTLCLGWTDTQQFKKWFVESMKKCEIN